MAHVPLVNRAAGKEKRNERRRIDVIFIEKNGIFTRPKKKNRVHDIVLE
jgi:hypothetical protein